MVLALRTFISLPVIAALWLAAVLLPASCGQRETQSDSPTGPFIVILGTLQDGGSPHINCARPCCAALSPEEQAQRMVVSLGIADPRSGRRWIVEATPDLPDQLRLLRRFTPMAGNEIPDGVFLTHAHTGHYAGLIHFGKEAGHTSELPVYAMPRMKAFLEVNAPWSQLVMQHNIRIEALVEGRGVTLGPNLLVTPLPVPHRDELSETVCFVIEGPHKKALFIPDIDKWEKWEQSIAAWIGRVDYAFLDATFYDGRELKTRDLSLIPHPFVSETLSLFGNLPATERKKIYFIHFNHTNPLIDGQSAAAKHVRGEGYGIARPGQVFEL